MGTIAEKLSYLADTKELFKDRLNSLGAEITSSTTFRNYLNWLDTFYGEVSDKTDLSVNGVVGRTSQNTAILPSEYTQVDYIESSGTQYIDTGVIPIDTTSIEAKVKITDMTQARNYVCGCYSTNTSNRFQLSFLGDVVDRNIMWCRGNAVSRAYVTPSQNNLYKIKTNEADLIINEQSIVSSFGSFDNQAISIFLFGNNSNGNASSLSNGEKMYYFKIYDNNELVRDFIPCYRNSDNEVGLYDIVNDVFYTNQGTGAFTYGSVVSIPNPDYPQPINNLTGNVAYKVSGKNLAIFEQPDTTISGLTIIYDDATGKISIKGKATTTTGVRVSKQMQTNIPSGTYTLSINSALPVLINYVVTDSQNNNTAFRMTAGNTSVTNTLSNNGVQASLFVAIENNVQYDLEFYMQLESGSTPTTYEPYISQTFNIPLGDIELCKIDTYEDKIYSSNGRFYLEKKNGKVVLNGSENWQTELYTYYLTNFNAKPYSTFSPTTPYAYANYFKWGNGSSGSFIEGCFWYTLDGSKLRVEKEYPLDLNTFKTWLNTHNTIVYYALATPTTTEITQENYLSLYNALKQIQDYLTAYKINKEFILGYSSPEIEY